MTLHQRTSRLAEAWDLCLEVQYAHPLIENKDWNNCVVRTAEDYQVHWLANTKNCGLVFTSRLSTKISVALSSTVCT